MIFYRCKCGNLKSWSSMGAAPCRVCRDCGTTLACNPEDHRTDPEPHDWHEETTESTWRGQVTHRHFRKCLACGEHEDLLPARSMG